MVTGLHEVFKISTTLFLLFFIQLNKTALHEYRGRYFNEHKPTLLNGYCEAIKFVFYAFLIKKGTLKLYYMLPISEEIMALNSLLLNW